MQDKVNQYQKKLINETQNNHHHLDPIVMQNMKHKDRFSKSIGREHFANQRRSSNTAIGDSVRPIHHKNSLAREAALTFDGNGT